MTADTAAGRAGIFRSVHGECKTTHNDGWEEMVAMAARAAESPGFSQSQLRLQMLGVAQRSFHDGEGHQRRHRRGLASRGQVQYGRRRPDPGRGGPGCATSATNSPSQGRRMRGATLDSAARDRVTLDARLTALTTAGADARPRRAGGLPPGARAVAGGREGPAGPSVGGRRRGFHGGRRPVSGRRGGADPVPEPLWPVRG